MNERLKNIGAILLLWGIAFVVLAIIVAAMSIDQGDLDILALIVVALIAIGVTIRKLTKK
jgi:steroid 5-alpha reductase family enzyme